MQVDAQFDKESKKATAIFITARSTVVQPFRNTRDLETTQDIRYAFFPLAHRTVLLIRESAS